MNIKRVVLLKKVQKFFEQHPDQHSTIIKMKVGNIDTHWSVKHKKGQFQITEINSSKSMITIKEDLTTAGGKGSKKPFEYDPNQQLGVGGTVAPGAEQQKYAQQKGSPASVGAAAQAIRSGPLGKTFQPGQQPPALPTKQQQTIKKIDKFAAGKNHFDPQVMKQATQKLSDQEFGQYYGFSKQSALQRHSTPPPLPSKVKKAGMKPYGESKIMKEASPAFSKISAAFMDYMAKQNDHIAQSNFINTISREKSGLVNQQEKDSVAAIESQYLGQATKATDASTKQTPLAGMKQQQQQSMKRPLTQGIERKYRVIMREADGDIKGIDQSSDVEQPKQEPSEELPEPEPQKSGEEKAVSKLAGQTIKSADVQFDENGGKLTLELANTQHPAVLEWSRTGRVAFHWKGQKYVLKK